MKFGKKISVYDFSILIKKNLEEEKNEYEFDLTMVEWITGEATTFLFAIINFLKNNNKNIIIKLPNPGKLLYAENEEINVKRRHNRFASLVDIWKIEEACGLKIGKEIIVPLNYHLIIKEARRKYYYIDSSLYKILPFKKIKTIAFKNINNIREHLDDKLHEIYKLEEDTLLLLNKFNSNIPFENKTLSHLLTTELFLNTIFHSKTDESYFSIALNSEFNIDIEIEKFKKQNYNYLDAKNKANNKIKWLINKLLPETISEEREDEVIDFFKKDNKFINRSYIEFNYIDFGVGIPETLRKEFNKFKSNNDNLKNELNLFDNKEINDDTKIIEYAFLLDSSKDNFNDSLKIKDYLPRGLYFIKEIIKRYQGLIIIRSGKGNLIYNFSDIEDKVIPGNIKYNFPGTMITIFIPNISKNGEKINNIEGAVECQNFKHSTYKGIIKKTHISIGQILSDIYKIVDNNNDKEKLSITLYNNFFNALNNKLKIINESNEKQILYIDFAGINLSFIELKIFFYLVNTPYINENYTNVAIININNDYIDRLYEIQELIRNTKPFHFRPIPCIIQTKNKTEILWLGVYSKIDEKSLTNLLLSSEEDNFISISSIENPDLLKGNIFKIDWVNRQKNSGQIILNYFPDIKEINYENCFGVSKRLTEKVKKLSLVWLRDKNVAYLTSGGKYQYQFLNFIELLATTSNDGSFYSKQIARYLINKWLFNDKELPKKIDWIVSVTLSGQILAREVLNELKVFYRGVKKPKLLRLAHYYEFENEEYGLSSIKENEIVIIVTDVVSTGDLLQRLTKSIENNKAKVVKFLSIADIRNQQYINNTNISLKLTTLMLPKDFNSDSDFDFNKYENIKKKNIIRINPIINAPVSRKLEDRKDINKNILFEFKEFINNYIDNKHLLIGYFKNNNTFHSYFFDTNNYFKSEIGKSFFSELLNRCSTKIDKKHNIVAFPIFSGIENINELFFKEELLNRNLIYPNSIIIPLPRVDTPNGWRFSFPPESLSSKISGNVLLIDDGSLSGETIIQMIDFICFFPVNNVTLLSIFGRLRDFQKEFFSQISRINNIKNNINVFFGIHAHIPFYPFHKSFPLHNEFNTLRNIKIDSNNIVDEERSYIVKRSKIISAKPLRIVDSYNDETPEYFPKKNDKIEKKKIYILRDAIGKLEHYRLYKEYYSEFKIETNEEIELLLAILLHEPSLITIVKNLLPEIFKNLQGVITCDVIEDKNNKLFYKWSDESLIRLMLLINKNYFLKKETILYLAKRSINNEYIQGFLIYEYNKILNEDNVKSISLKDKIYEASERIAEEDLFDKSLLKPILRNFERMNNKSVRNAIEKLKYTIYKDKILPRHSEFVEAKSPIYSNLRNTRSPIDHQKIDKLINLIDVELLEPLKIIQECDSIIPIKHDLFNGENTIIDYIINLKDKLERIEDNSEEREDVAEEMKDFIDNFTTEKKELIDFLSNYPSNVKDSINSCITKYFNNSKIKFNTNKIENCILELPIHQFYFEFILKEIFNNIQNLYNNDIFLDYIYDDNSFTIIQNKPFINNNNKDGGLHYIKKIVQLFDGRFEEEKDKYEYKMIFNFNKLQ